MPTILLTKKVLRTGVLATLWINWYGWPRKLRTFLLTLVQKKSSLLSPVRPNTILYTNNKSKRSLLNSRISVFLWMRRRKLCFVLKFDEKESSVSSFGKFFVYKIRLMIALQMLKIWTPCSLYAYSNFAAQPEKSQKVAVSGCHSTMAWFHELTQLQHYLWNCLPIDITDIDNTSSWDNFARRIKLIGVNSTDW